MKQFIASYTPINSQEAGLYKHLRHKNKKNKQEYFPFYITHILTDNGLEFTDKFSRGKNTVSGNHKFDMECRLTAPATPKTNGMVERANGTIKNGTIKAT